MTTAEDGGVAGVEAFLANAAPAYELHEPTSAPPELLEGVRVDTPGQCLRAGTPVGPIALELYWRAGKYGEEERADFFAPLPANIDPGATNNPPATQHYPYTILQGGAQYEIVVRAPCSAVDAEWSDERALGPSEGAPTALGPISLADFHRLYPGVAVNQPPGMYNVAARGRTMTTLGVLARVENGEPLTRKQLVQPNGTVRYQEIPSMGAAVSGLDPNMVLLITNSRCTIAENSTQATSQGLVFATNDGLQRTGEGAAAHSGLVELIVVLGKMVRYTGFTFSDATYNKGPGLMLPPDYEKPSTIKDFYGADSRKSPAPTSAGLEAGQTRFLAPKTVAVDMASVLHPRTIAAFRFAMAAAA